ncbi:MAG: hypothetical protein AB9900_10960 [Humidesulfovibrio sp.]
MIGFGGVVIILVVVLLYAVGKAILSGGTTHRGGVALRSCSSTAEREYKVMVVDEYGTHYDESEDDRIRREWHQDLRMHLGSKQAKKLEPCLRKLFGGDIQCAFNFRMFAARVGFGNDACDPAVYIVPMNDHYRPRFEALARTGLVLTGPDVSIPQRLERVAIARVRRVAAQLGLGKSRNKMELAQRIAAADPQTAEAALAAEGLGAQDCFLLDPERVYQLCR